jgi:prepilin-type N-terminal cleavage/methylation domain-containing protein
MMKLASPKTKAFTLIELMLVVAIIGIALAMGMPAIRRMANPDPMTKAVKDVVELCSHARARAILNGVTMELRIYPHDGRFEVAQAPEDVNLADQDSITNADGTVTSAAAAPPPVRSEAGSDSSGASADPNQHSLSGQLSDRVVIKMCDINFGEYKDEEVGRVRFHPNGICDNFTLVLRSDKNEFKKISLEEVTGLAEVSDVK